MQRFFVSIALVCLSLSASAQQGLTFSVEKLSPPENLLTPESPRSIYEGLILKSLDMYPSQLERDGIEFPFGIAAMSRGADSLVNFGYHSFFEGMHHAYAEHRPFVLSPDMLWLLISQGFAQHVNADPQGLRRLFVEHGGKISLVVRDDRIRIDDPDAPWEKVFPQFAAKMKEHVDESLVDLLAADFSTTTPAERVASQITLMKAMESYFDYNMVMCVCGIPEITLLGTPEDWQKVLDRTQRLARYDLEWWTDELEPVLRKIIETSRGKIDPDFWRGMFKRHATGSCGAGSIYFDGWIVKFFPYDKYGKRNNLNRLSKPYDLPEEIVRVDLQYIYEPGRPAEAVTTPLELWAGFVGLEQDPRTFALKPVVGWMVRRKDADSRAKKLSFESEARSGEISVRVGQFPAELLGLSEIRSLVIEFTGPVDIPDELAEVNIRSLTVKGKIGKKERQRLVRLFPDTRLYINSGKKYYDKGRLKRKTFTWRPEREIGDSSYKVTVDRLLRERLGSDFSTVLRYRSTTNCCYCPEGFPRLFVEDEDMAEGVCVNYTVQLPTGQPVYCPGSSCKFYLDKEGNLLGAPAVDPVDFDGLRWMYMLLGSTAFLTEEQAETLALGHIPPEYDRNGGGRLAYDKKSNRVYWQIERYYGVRRGEVMSLRIDAVTGGVLGKNTFPYEGRRYRE